MRLPTTLRRAVLVIVLVLTACGSPEPDAAAPTPGGTDAAALSGAAETNAPPQDGTPSITDGRAATSPPQSSTAKPGSAAATTPAPVQSAQQATVNEPKLGSYVYAVSGTRQSPFSTPPNAEQPIPEGETLTIDYIERRPVSAGVEFVSRERAGDGSQRTTTRFEATRILVVETVVSTPQGNVTCKYSTPEGGLLVGPVPPRAGSFPRQEWSNESCSGHHQIQILGQEPVKDANGKTWNTWKGTATTYVKFGTELEATLTQTVWFSPDLGVEVRADQVTDAKFQGAPVKSNTVNVLSSHP